MQETATFDKLDLVTEVRNALSNKQTRIALSHLFNNPARTAKLNDFIDELQNIQTGEDGSNIEVAKAKFLKLVDKLPALSALAKTVSGIAEPKALEAALYDIRGAMMMDENQARRIQVKSGVVNVNEAPDATKKRFESMINGEKM